MATFLILTQENVEAPDSEYAQVLGKAGGFDELNSSILS